MAAASDKDICGLDVAVDDAARVGSVEAFGDLRAEIQNLFERERLSADEMLQRIAFEKLHGEKRAAAIFADIVDGADVGMI